ncbi:uncharacterized protein LACBIDRAFT_304182 [Laccaria bicolor S238N-H82]|uniref:Predicted protein n=1 Tax=Laccaria bicolor (strain S238N-H82 / ATCC MYA-4686) TaxID=486041 RepID=B0DL49_LACBS|nr:uncharacterized protein LACBIDRAFT_304182 [Laccaria bicolor S238N-H82]EDR04846.1 predicted protein [Laccaria bicolor S238N-H82]|eukprot:XP_001884670.1 predicted protein [Laccaria bicolor S238N-H82]
MLLPTRNTPGMAVPLTILPPPTRRFIDTYSRLRPPRSLLMQLQGQIAQTVFSNLMRRYPRGIIEHASSWKVAAQHSAHQPISLGQVLAIVFGLST